jgi:uncharacterized membrane protein
MKRGRIAALVLALTAAFWSVAEARSLAIQSFDAEIRVNPDGTIDVVEVIRPRFTGMWNGIYRTIPVEYRTDQGFNYTLVLDVDSVTDGAGTPLRYESSRERHYRKLKIWVPNAVNALRTVILRYRVENGLKFFEEHDELYWNVTGDEWEAPIESVNARVHLPPGAASLRAVAFTGGYGSRERAAEVETLATGVNVRSLRALNFGEGLTVVVGWDPGVVKRPGPMQTAWFVARSNVPLAIPPIALVGMWWLWSRKGRDPNRLPIAARYEPPEGLSPAEVGTLVDNSPGMRDLTATIVDLAVKGYLVIEQTEEDRMLGLWSSNDYIFTLKKPRAAWGALAPHEQKLLTALFREAGSQYAGEESVRLSALKNKFYKDLPGIKETIFRKLVDRGLYPRRPDHVRMFYLVAAGVVGLAIGYGGSVLSAFWGIQPTSAIVAGVLTGIIVAAFGWIMPVRTIRGARALEASLGFEEFLERVESDRFDRMVRTPEMFEKYLPYAMALGVEENWARAFQDVYKQPPNWYRGGNVHAFRTGALVGDLNQMSTRSAAVMTSSPRGSGGSGFSGGSSGGGFGGGGGGGF